MLASGIMLLTTGPLFAQVNKLSKADTKRLKLQDDSLGKYGVKILDAPNAPERLRADSMFTRILVRALRSPWSFYYTFDSLKTAPVVYPADSSFRFITWHYTTNDQEYHQRGALQMNTPDGSLKLYPLYDVSDYTDAPEDSIRGPQNWIGAIYYKIVQKKWQGKNYYTLLGYDENNERTTRKWMDVLSFTANGEPRWGGSIGMVKKSDSAKPGLHQRFCIEYKKEGLAKLNFDTEEDLIIMDHLISESNEPEKIFTLVPSGDYEGFKWSNGQWNHISRLAYQNLGDGREPHPALILGENGQADENKLQEQSDKNMKKMQPRKKEKKKGG